MRPVDDVITFLVKVAAELLRDGSFSDSVAEQLEYQLRAEYGGERVYVPKLAGDERRAAVLSRFNGRNRKELCAEYRISKTQFYRFLKGQ